MTDAATDGRGVVAFRTNIWKAPQTKLWCLVAAAVLVMIAWLYMLLVWKVSTEAFLVVEAFIGISTAAMALLLVKILPRLIASGRVDDSGIHGQGLFRREIDFNWTDVRAANKGRDQKSRIASLIIESRSGRSYMLWSGHAVTRPEVAAAEEQLARHSVAVAPPPGPVAS